MIFWIPVRSLLFALLLPAAAVFAGAVPAGASGAVPDNGLSRTTAPLFPAAGTSADEAAPVVASLSPAHEAADVRASAKLEITFSEEVVAGEGDITIAVGETTQTLAANSKDVKINKEKVTLNLPGNFPDGAQVSVQVPAGAFKDETGNAFAGIAAGAWRFSVASKDAPADETAPTVAELSPADGATEVPRNAKLEITFSEEIQAGTGQISVTIDGNTQVVEVPGNTVKVNKEKVTLELAGDFPEGAQVSVQVPVGSFEDAAGNDFGGLAAGEWNFTVKPAAAPVDNTAPTVAGLSPGDDVTEVAENAKLEITFSEEVVAGSKDIIITVNGTAQLVGARTSAVKINKEKVTIEPPADFPAGAAVSVVVPAGTFADAAGNDFAGIAAGGWNFTVTPPADNAPPVVAGLSPANGTADVAISTNSLEISFDENINKGSGNITVSGNGVDQSIGVGTNAVKVNGRKATIDLAQALPYATAVSVAVPQGAFEDETGNDFAGLTASAWTFTTVDAPAPTDQTAPTIAGLSPDDEATEVAENAKLEITFSEEVVAASGDITITVNGTAQTVGVRTDAVKSNKEKVTIDAGANFPAGAAVSVAVPAGAFEDAAGNDFAGIAATGWNFTVKPPVDNTPPVVTAREPANNDNNVAVNARLVLDFDEKVKKGQGQIVLSQADNTQNIDISSEEVSVNGSKVTVSHSKDFSPGSSITVQIPQGAFQDEVGNAFPGINDWTFRTAEPADETAPTIVTLSPDDEATEVAENAKLEITFSEEVQAGTGDLTITVNGTPQTVGVRTNAVKINKEKVTIDLAGDFPAGAEVSVSVPAGAFEDAAGNDFAGIAAGGWNFTVTPPADNAPPVVAGLSPANGAPNVAISTNSLEITFDENITKGSGNITLTGTDFTQTIDIATNAVRVNGKKVTIDLAQALPFATAISVTVPAGAFEDETGNDFAGLAGSAWTFTTVDAPAPTDQTAPTVAGLSPDDEATEVAENAKLEITFSEEVVAGSGDITITVNGTAQTVGVRTNAIRINKEKVTIDAGANFPAGAAVSAAVPAGAFEDAAGNDFAGLAAGSWNFTVKPPVDNTPPVITAREPANNDNNVAVNARLVLDFDEKVKKGQGQIVLFQADNTQNIDISSEEVSVNGSKVTISHSKDFSPGSSITVQIPQGAFQDEVGNAFPGVNDWTFRTAEPADETAPTVVGLSPDDEATEVAENAKLEITFSEEVKAGTGDITITVNGTPQTVGVRTNAVQINKEKITIDAANFPAGAAVSVVVPAGAFEDAAGNDFAGIAAGGWNFTVKPPVDNTAPTVAGLSPANGAPNVAISTNSLEITFDENITKGSGNITLTGTGVTQSIGVGTSAVKVNGKKATIDLAQALPYATAVSVTVPQGAFEDETGNDFAGLTASAWTFTTVDAPAPTDQTAPTVAGLSPDDEATEVAENAKLEITFSEEVVARTGNITITVNGTPQTVDVTTNAVKINKEKVTIDAASNFPAGAAVSVAVPAGAFEDAAGNDFAGLTATGWNFTVKPPVDNVAPTVAGLSPANGAPNVAISTNSLEITFDENITKGSGNITLTGTGVTQSIGVGTSAVKVDGKKATIDLAQALPFATAVSVAVPQGAFEDETGNDFAGLAASAWTFTTVDAPAPTDQTAPTVAGLSPDDEATEVAENAQLEITFSEEVQAGTGDLTITVNGTPQTVGVRTDAVKINKEKVTIDAGANFPAGAAVSVAVPAGAFEDAAGNDFVGLAAGSWNFTVKPPVDNTPPVITAREPANNDNNVAVNARLVLDFDEKVKKGQGQIVLSQADNTQNIDISSEEVSVNGSKVTISHSKDFSPGSSITVQIPQGAFQDEVGNAFPGINDWTFRTAEPADETAPTVATLSPDDEATEVAENAKLEITFSEEVKAGTGDITITVNGTPQTVGVRTAGVKINKEKVTIDAASNFPAGAAVSVAVPAGAFEDAAGNDFAGLTATGWNFTVKPPVDNTPPLVAGLSPADDATGVAISTNSLEITFDENINKGTGSIIVTGTDFTQTVDVTTDAVQVNGKKATIDLAQALPYATAVSVAVPQGAFEDETGNDFAGLAASAWTFTTVDAPAPTDQTAPTVAGLSPDDEATEVAENAKLEITFSEEVKAGTGDITITVNGTPQTVGVRTNAVQINKEKITIDAALFPAGAAVSVAVPAGAFEDAAGNDFAGLAAGGWNFTVKSAPTPGDQTAPVVTELSPNNGATNVAVSTNSLEITFDENINKGSGNITVSGNGVDQSIGVGTNAVKVNGRKATIDLSQALPFATAVSVTVPQSAFEDETGNDFAGLAASAWRFTTVDAPAPTDQTAPVVSSLSPADEATEVGENAKLEITFSEEVVARSGNITITVNGTPQTVDVTTNAVKINKEKVTIDAANFPAGAEVSIVVPAGAFEDAAGNDFAGLAAGGWNFTVKPAPTPGDQTAPVVAELSPNNRATNVAVSTNSLEITFDENINKGTGNITVTGEGMDQSIGVGTNAVKVNGRKATIDLAQAFPFATALSVTVPAGAFEDKTGNDFAGLAASAWTFTTVDAPAPTDQTAPVVSSLSPADGATEVAENAKLEITFSEEVVARTGNITITVNGTAQTVDVTTNAVTINKEKVTIDAEANFPAGAEVSVQIPAGAFEDALGNDFAGLAAGSWNFTVKPAPTPGDDKPPVITAREPANNASDIAVNARLVIDFNEKVRKGQGNITLSQAGNSENISVNSEQVSIAGSKATIAPAKDFAYNSPVTVAIAAGVFQDEVGNPFAGSSEWTFRTTQAADETAPTVADLSPADEATEVGENAKLEITFNEEVVARTGNITITVNGTPQTVDVTTNAVKINKEKVTIDAANFPAGAEVSIVVPAGAFEDAAGNDFAGLAAGGWNFTVKPAPTPGDQTAPVVAELSPNNGATNVAVSTNSLEISFDENINKGTGNITVTGTGFTQTVDVATNAVKVNGKNATIDLAQALPFATTVSVTVPAGAFEDETGNDFAGLAASAWTFTTVDAPAPTDQTAPVVSSLSPADGATEVAENAKLEITFSEEVVARSGNITITVNGTPQTVDVTTNAVTINKEKVTIDAAANFPAGAEVSVVVPAGAFEDAVGNDFAGLAAGSWNFTVKPAPTPGDNAPPVVADLSPNNGATNVAVSTSSLEITFDENINKGSGNITVSGNGVDQSIGVGTNAVKVNGKKATIDLSQAFPFATALSVTVPAGAFEDETGNDFAGLAASAWTFTTVDAPAPTDQTAPTIATLSPDDEATEVAENAKLEITFSEEVVAGSGDITITATGTPQTVGVRTDAVKINKERVTIDAGANFPAGAAVSVAVPAGAFEDAAGNDFAGLAAGGWNFTVKSAPTPGDQTAPVVAELSPNNGATNVAVSTSSLEITFDENINKGTGSIIVTGTDFTQTVDVATNAVKVNGKKATIDLAQALPFATAVSVTVPAGAFEDETGNDFAGLAASAWRFTTVDAPAPTDQTAPVVSSLSPADGATEVAENAKLEITFSEEVVARSGNITITVNGTPQTVDVTTNAVKINKEKVTIDAAADFPAGAEVSVQIPAGAFEDAAGNDFAGLAASSWNFTVKPAPTPGDNAPPVVAELSPNNGATNVAVSTNSLEITFDENINKGSGNITVTGEGVDQSIGVGTNAVKVNGRKATIDLAQALPFATAVSVTVPAGAFEDETGNDFAGLAASAWRFTTVDAPAPTDQTAPVVSSLSPADGATEVGENAKLEITFSEEVVARTGNITITVNGTPQTVDVTTNAVKINKEKVTIDAANFPAGAAVSVVVPAGAFEDAAGNDFAGLAAGGWNFTVKSAPTPGDQTAPVVAELSPNNGATNVAVSTSSLEITFDENINKGTGSIIVTGTDFTQTVDVATDAVKVNGKKATIDLDQALPFTTAVSVTVPQGAFEDETGNDFAGLAASAWRFTTVDAPAPTDQTAPVVSSLSPADEATEVGENAKLEITFSEEVVARTGNITITVNSTPQTVDVTTNAVKINKEKVTIDAAADFPAGAEVSVQIQAGTFEDAAGNDFAGLAAGGWNFTVKSAPTPGDQTAPVVTELSPNNGATNVAVSTNSLEITFDENINKGSGNITVSGNGVDQSIGVGTNAVKVNGRKATIDLAQALPFATTVSVTVPAGAFEDETGNDFAGLAASAWTFTTVDAPAPTDQTAPVVSSLSPADGATEVAENAKLEITFSEEVIARSGNITITVNGTPQTVDLTTNAVKVNKEKVTIDAANFPAGAEVSVQIPAGAFEDAAGNDFAGLAAGGWNFTVKSAPTPGDQTAPVVAELSPNNGATNVAVSTNSLEITFDENINKGTGNITLTGTGFTQTVDVTTNAVKVNGKKATIDLSQALPFATTVSVTVPAGAFEDETGNDFAGLAASAWTFTTVDAPAPTDQTAPVVSSLSPADGATEVAENAKLEITFSEEVVARTGNITITVNGTPQTVDVTTNAVKINKEKVTIDAAADFPAGAEVSVLVPAGAFEDAVGNDFAGLAASSWNFTVKPAPTPGDNAPPVVADLSPNNGATNVAVSTSSLEITFDENINKGSGNITVTGEGMDQSIGVGTNAVKVNGKKATIDLSQAFPFATTVSVTVPAGAFEDETGNDFAGLAASAWRFITVDAPAPTDQTAPVVSSLSPADEATEVGENAKLEITFSEEVVARTGNITITVNGTAQMVDVTTNAITINKEKVTIEAANFPAGAGVSVVVPAGAFEDAAGNDFAGLAAGGWNFTVKSAPTPGDQTAPVVAELSPNNGATNVAVSTNSLEITFDENINKGTGSIIVTGTDFTQTVDVATDAVKVNGKKATIDLDQALPFTTAVSVTVPQGAFEDETGNDFAGLAASAWRFTTVDAPAPTDQTAPVVSSLSPADEATEVGENAKLEITFSEEVVARTGNITITVNGTPQTVNVTTNAVKINKEKVTIDAAADFPAGAEVSVLVPAGAFEDIAGNDFAGLTAGSWNFTVKAAPVPVDDVPPVVAALEPAHNATDVPVNANLVITFDENVEKGAGTITLNQGTTTQVINLDDAAVAVAGKRVTINPSADFPPAANVSVTIPAGAFRDASGNDFAGITAETWRFTTAPAPTPVDDTPPVVTNLSPADDATDVPPNAKLVLTFSESILKGTGNITVTVGDASRTINAAGGDVTVRGNTATIDPKGNLPEGAAVHVLVPAGTFRDRANLPFAGIAEATSWNFTIRAADQPTDIAAPVITALSPADNATDVAPDAELTIEFSERIRKANGFITINYGTNSQVIDVTSSAVRLGNNRVTIDPTANLPVGTAVYVQVPAGAFEDESGNPFAGIAGPTAWNFTTAGAQDKAGPAVVRLTPASGATGVAEDARLEIEFNETVRRGSGTIILAQGNSQQSFPVTGTALTITGNRAFIKPPASFPAGATVSVQIPAGAFRDVQGNNFAGLTDPADWRFTVAGAPPATDVEAPTITALSPTDNATGIAVGTTLQMTFSEPVKKGNGGLAIRHGDENYVLDLNSAAVRITGNRVTVTLPVPFPYQTAVSVTVSPGAFEDQSGNDFAGITDATAWNFTTSAPPAPNDQEPPLVTAFSPVRNARNVAPDVKLVMTFNEEVQAGSGLITLSQGGSSQTIGVGSSDVTISGKTVTISPASPLPRGVDVNVQMPAGAFRDLKGNAYAGLTGAAWTFSVASTATRTDNTAPEVTAYSPPPNAREITGNTNLILTFSEEVKKGTGFITIGQSRNSQTINVTSPAVTVSGNTVTINPPVDLPEGTRITVQMPKGVFADASGNEFAGIASAETWAFNTVTPKPSPTPTPPVADNAPPRVHQLSPPDNTTGVPINTNLVITFSEKVTKGEGIILISYPGTQLTVDVNSPSVTVAADSIITIDPPGDFPVGAAVNVQMPAGTFVDRQGNPFLGINNPSIWNFRIYSPADDLAPLRILSTEFPDVINDNVASTEAAMRVSNIPPNTTAQLVYRGIAETNWSRVPVNVTDNLRISAALPQAWFDEIGLEYYFEITVFTTFRITSDRGYTYRNYTADGQTIPDLRTGTTAADYQIISVPLMLRDPSVATTLEDNLGDYNPRKWRLFAYRNGVLQENEQGFTTIDPNQGYWLLMKDQRNVATGEGSTHRVYQESPYVIRLQKGWNQIGNPYNFNVVWGDVKAFNRNPAGLGGLRVFDRGFQNTDTLKKFRGAFVFAETDMMISIPVLKNKAANGRIAQRRGTSRITQAERDDRDLAWLVNFDLYGDHISYRLGGVGMHRQASAGKDAFDDLTPPRFSGFLEMNFDHPEYFARRFTRDVVPDAPAHTWTFTVAAGTARQGIRLDWEGLFDKIPSGHQLYLYDEKNGTAVDMLRQGSYAFGLDSAATFRVVYGPESYIREHLPIREVRAGLAFPNPFVDRVQIPVALPQESDAYTVRLQIFSAQGALMNTVEQVSLAPGVHYFTWDGADAGGRRVPSGMYVGRLEVIAPGVRKEFTQKLILR